MAAQKGKFIVIDGTDGSGKATQTKLIVDRLKKEGQKVEIIDFPQYGSKSAGMVEEYLNGKYGSADDVGPYAASIFYAVDRYDASFKIREWLTEGKIVISNRYISSNMGHQAGKIDNKKEREKYLKWLGNLEFGIFGIPKPDLTILLYMPPGLGQKRVDKKGYREYVNGEKRDIHEANLKHLEKAAQAYKYVAEKYKWSVINGDRSIEEIHKDIYALVSKHI
jgi:dTMP kinase